MFPSLHRNTPISAHMCIPHTCIHIQQHTYAHTQHSIWCSCIHPHIICTFAHIYAHMHALVHAHEYIQMPTHIHIHTHVHTYVHVDTHTHTCHHSASEWERKGRGRKKKTRQCENRAESNEKPHGGKRPPMVARPCSAHLSPSPWCPLCHAWFCPGGPCSCPNWTGRDSCLDCRLLMRDNMSRCPAEYCSMTSITSYGRRLSLNFRLDTKNRITLQRWTDHEFQTEATLPGASSHIHLSPSNSSKTTIPGK